MVICDSWRPAVSNHLPPRTATGRYGLVSHTHQSFTRQLAFGDLVEPTSKSNIHSFFGDWRSNLLAKVVGDVVDEQWQAATLLIFGITVILLVVFWIKNRQLEMYWRERLRQEGQ